jgi:hypothetical protein
MEMPMKRNIVSLFCILLSIKGFAGDFNIHKLGSYYIFGEKIIQISTDSFTLPLFVDGYIILQSPINSGFWIYIISKSAILGPYAEYDRPFQADLLNGELRVRCGKRIYFFSLKGELLRISEPPLDSSIKLMPITFPPQVRADSRIISVKGKTVPHNFKIDDCIAIDNMNAGCYGGGFMGSKNEEFFFVINNYGELK